MNPNSLKNLTYRFPKGSTPWNKGKKGIHLSPDTEFKKGRKDERHPGWKGEEVGYHGLHKWVSRWKGLPSLCDNCGTTQAKRFDWANIDHKYRRVLDDYIRLCAKCHFAHDVKFNGKKYLVSFTKRMLKNHGNY